MTLQDLYKILKGLSKEERKETELKIHDETNQEVFPVKNLKVKDGKLFVVFE